MWGGRGRVGDEGRELVSRRWKCRLVFAPGRAGAGSESGGPSLVTYLALVAARHFLHPRNSPGACQLRVHRQVAVRLHF